ncbi:hypothetical protein EYF80_020868 [Liparis tanakae]|uniref:Uncharacterized protein n=1 Tax=Liparis tanakae TaxID=230148 RepID=A0A4Z2HV46_9TELE|nr:hypothetical protein EYF80_020868 [Liparis tanakae]
MRLCAAASAMPKVAVELTQRVLSYVAVGPGSQDIRILQPPPQGPHPPRAPEEGVPPGSQSTQLLHPPLFGSPVLEPDLQRGRSCSRMCRVGFGVATNAAFNVSSCLALMVVRGPRLLVPEFCSSFSILFVSLSEDVELSGDKLLSVHDDTDGGRGRRGERRNKRKVTIRNSFPSLEKHFSVRLQLHSQHWTHLACHARSSTLRRNRSRMGRSQPAQWTIMSPACRAHSADLPTRTALLGLGRPGSTRNNVLAPGEVCCQAKSLRKLQSPPP